MKSTRALLPVCLLAALMLGGCSASPAPAPASTAPTTPTATPQPKTEDGAKAAAQEAFDRYTSGDFAGAWLMYSDEGRAAVTQADYVRLNTACPKLQRIQVTIAAVRIDGDKATVRAQLGQLVDSYVMDYQHGQWLLEPTATALANYKAGIDQTIAASKANGSC